MPSRHDRLAACALVTTLIALAPTTAAANAGVYGGHTKAGDPIVIRTDAAGKKLTSATFRIRVDGDARWWSLSGDVPVRPAATDPMTVPTGVLVAERNSGGRFEATLMAAISDDGTARGIRLKGTIRGSKATGSILGWVTTTDQVSGDLAEAATTPVVKWTAERAAGRVFGGATADDQPIVLKLDRRRTEVAELWVSCATDRTTPPGMTWSSSESLVDFPLVKGRFGDVFSYPVRYPDGATLTYAWRIAGRVTVAKATGTIALQITDDEPTGETYGATMPPTRFTALSG